MASWYQKFVDYVAMMDTIIYVEGAKFQKLGANILTRGAKRALLLPMALACDRSIQPIEVFNGLITIAVKFGF